MSLITSLVSNIADFDHVRHLFLLLVKLLLQLFVDLIKGHAFTPQVINFLTQHLVVGKRLVEFDEGFVQSILEHLDLLLDLVIIFLGSVYPSELGTLIKDFHSGQVALLFDFLQPAAFNLHLARVAVSEILQLSHLFLNSSRYGGCVRLMAGNLVLERDVIVLQLLNGSSLATNNNLGVFRIGLTVALHDAILAVHLSQLSFDFGGSSTLAPFSCTATTTAIGTNFTHIASGTRCLFEATSTLLNGNLCSPPTLAPMHCTYVVLRCCPIYASIHQR
mmetsp:Transcript_2665/g.3019  ORF Transcript_2665/g.3019 Transcript_2665/m.3019 type:complete len:276 (+) Transcript_2665:1798-2625(+)